VRRFQRRLVIASDCGAIMYSLCSSFFKIVVRIYWINIPYYCFSVCGNNRKRVIHRLWRNKRNNNTCHVAFLPKPHREFRVLCGELVLFWGVQCRESRSRFYVSWIRPLRLWKRSLQVNSMAWHGYFHVLQGRSWRRYMWFRNLITSRIAIFPLRQTDVL